MTASNNMLRRTMLQATAFGSIAAMLGGMPQARASGSEAFPQHPSWRFVFVSHVTTNPFFVPPQYDMAGACSLLGCEHQWTGSVTSDVSEMVNAVNAAIAVKTAAIAVSIIDLILRLQAKGDVSIVMIMHNYAHTLEIADHVMLLQRGRVTYENTALATSVVELMDIVGCEYRKLRNE